MICPVTVSALSTVVSVHAGRAAADRVDGAARTRAEQRPGEQGALAGLLQILGERDERQVEGPAGLGRRDRAGDDHDGHGGLAAQRGVPARAVDLQEPGVRESGQYLLGLLGAKRGDAILVRDRGRDDLRGSLLARDLRLDGRARQADAGRGEALRGGRQLLLGGRSASKNCEVSTT